VCSGQPRTRRFSLLATVRASHKATADHGGAAVLGMAASGGVGSKNGQRAGLAFKATAHACWGARLRAPRPARVCARGHARNADAMRVHRHSAAVTKRWRRPTARGERLGGWRARRRRRRHLQKIATKPGSMAGLTSSGAVARNVPPRLDGHGVHRGEETASSPGWPLAEAQASVKGCAAR
jgi:hypothetical protein